MLLLLLLLGVLTVLNEHKFMCQDVKPSQPLVVLLLGNRYGSGFMVRSCSGGLGARMVCGWLCICHCCACEVSGVSRPLHPSMMSWTGGGLLEMQ